MVRGMYTYRFVTFSTNLQLDQIEIPYFYDLGISGKGTWLLKPLDCPKYAARVLVGAETPRIIVGAI